MTIGTLAENGAALGGWLKDNREIVGVLGAFLGALLAAAYKHVRQSREPDASFTEQATYAPRSATVRLHPEDRAALGELRDTACDLVRAVRRHGEIIADHADAIGRRARREPAESG